MLHRYETLLMSSQFFLWSSCVLVAGCRLWLRLCVSCAFDEDQYVFIPVTKECSHIEYGKQIAWSSVYGVSSPLIHVNWFQRELFHFQFIVTKHAKNVVPKKCVFSVDNCFLVNKYLFMIMLVFCYCKWCDGVGCVWLRGSFVGLQQVSETCSLVFIFFIFNSCYIPATNFIFFSETKKKAQ